MTTEAVVTEGVEAEGPVYPTLSPSRAADFKTCPLLYRFRTIDRLPERPSADQLRGTLVHAVLERLFDLPAADRTSASAAGLVGPEWERLAADHPELAELFAEGVTDADAPVDVPLPVTWPAPVPGPAELAPLLTPPLPAPAAAEPPAPAEPPASAAAPAASESGIGAGPASANGAPVAGPTSTDRVTPAGGPPGDGAAPMLPGPWPAPLVVEPRKWTLPDFLDATRLLLDGYFAVEDPRRLEPAERESLISALVDDQLLIRGYIDRLDVSPAGELRVVDYKTGGAPREAFEARALFQLKFYALVLWRTRGVVPRVLRLLYLKDQEVCDYSPDADELARFERTLVALWRAIEQAKQAKEFRPKPSRLCGWCAHRALCPAFGGSPPPFPEPRPPRTDNEDLAPTAEDS
jgi:putative RecB family exonuclease